MTNSTQTATGSTIASLLTEQRVFRPLPRVITDADINTSDLKKAHQYAEAAPLAYWEEAAEKLRWFRRWNTVLDDSTPPFFKWLSG